MFDVSGIAPPSTRLECCGATWALRYSWRGFEWSCRHPVITIPDSRFRSTLVQRVLKAQPLSLSPWPFENARGMAVTPDRRHRGVPRPSVSVAIKTYLFGFVKRTKKPPGRRESQGVVGVGKYSRVLSRFPLWKSTRSIGILRYTKIVKSFL